MLPISFLLFQCKPTLDLTTSLLSDNFTLYDSFILDNAPNEEAFVAVQRIAEPYIKARQWENAAEVYQKYQSMFSDNNRFDKIISVLLAEEEGLVVTNLGGNINTAGKEYSPVPSADGTQLYFTGRDRIHSLGKEDIFVSLFKNGKWQSATNLGKQINTKRNSESLDGISTDGNRLLFMGNFGNSFGDCDIYFVDRTTSGWGEIQHFSRPINSEFFEANASMLSDGKTIIFTSDRPGGIGDYQQKGLYFHGGYVGNVDIYVCTKTEDGWSEPINLGPTINTPYCEYSPFLHPDGKTLYFSSDGHYGLGRLDVYKSVRLSEDSWTKWSQPINLGKEINTTGDDWGYKVSTTGNITYFSANDQKEGYGDDDIYTIVLPEIARPEPVATIRGTVTDADNHPLEANIRWEDLSTGDEIGQLKSNAQDGTYFIVLPLNKNYGYYVSKSGFYPLSKNINLLGKNNPVNITEDIVLTSIQEMKEKNVTIRINNIFFEYDKYELLPESFPELDHLVVFLKENEDTKVEIAGHTDDKGSENYNIQLSEKRAQAIINYLVSSGCNKNNLIAKGYGELVPIATNETDEGRAKNRRVELRFL